MNKSKTINYYPALREYTGSINAALIVAHLESCFREKGKIFYKFMEPCGHRDYEIGTSWIEELHMTSTEFRTAFKHIAVVYKSKRDYNLSQDKFQGKMYLSYYDRISKLTYYMRNDDLVSRKLKELLEADEIDEQDRNHEIQDGIYNYNNINTKTNKSLEINKTNNKTNTETNKSLKTIRNQDIDSIQYADSEMDANLQDDTQGANVSFNIIQEQPVSLTSSLTTQTAQMTEMTQITQITQVAPITHSAHSQQQETLEMQPSGDEVPYEAIKELFNQICISHDAVQNWSLWQKSKIRKLWVKEGQDLAAFKAVFEKLEASDFLSGRVKAWKAQLDWLFKPTHFSDILNDKYQNYTKKKTERKGFCVDIESHDWDFDEIERLEQRRIDRILEESGFGLALC